jgi:hypothetical protein
LTPAAPTGSTRFYRVVSISLEVAIPMPLRSLLPLIPPWLALVCFASSLQASEAEKYLPDDAVFVLTTRVQVLFKAPPVKRNLERIKPLLKANYGNLTTALGLDPFNDIELMLLATPGAPGGGDTTRPFVIVEGTFDSTKFEETAAKALKKDPDVLKVEKIGPRTVYVVRNGSKSLYVTLLDERILVMSPSRAMILDAIEKKTGKKKTTLDKTLAALLAKQDSKEAVSLAAVESAGFGELSGLAYSLSGGISIKDDIKIVLALQTKDGKAAIAASKVKEHLESITTETQDFAQKDKRFEPLLDFVQQVKVGTTATMVTVKAEASKEKVKQFEKVLIDIVLPTEAKSKD